MIVGKQVFIYTLQRSKLKIGFMIFGLWVYLSMKYPTSQKSCPTSRGNQVNAPNKRLTKAFTIKTEAYPRVRLYYVVEYVYCS